MYMSSTSSADGSLLADHHVRDRHQPRRRPGAGAEPRRPSPSRSCPEEVRRQGVTVKKQSSNIVLAVSLTSPDKMYDGLFLSNYATLRLRDELSRVEGVGDVMVRGIGVLRHAGLARPGQAGAAATDDAGRDRRPAPAERAGRGRADRPAAERRRPGVPVNGHHARPAVRPGAVRGHRPRSRRRAGSSSICATWPASNSAPRPTTRSPRATAWSRPTS